jgi:hypothetical protein
MIVRGIIKKEEEFGISAHTLTEILTNQDKKDKALQVHS